VTVTLTVYCDFGSVMDFLHLYAFYAFYAWYDMLLKEIALDRDRDHYRQEVSKLMEPEERKQRKYGVDSMNRQLSV
jgi:hypothetical protein